MSEYLGEYFVNTLVNAFLQEVNTMNTFSIYNPLTIKKRYLRKYILYHVGVCIYVRKASIVFTDRVKVFIILFTKHSLKYARGLFEV